MRTLVTLLSTFLLVGAYAGSASASNLFKSGVAGIAVAGQPVAGIAGGAPWDAEGEAKVNFRKRGGQSTLKVEVVGLVLVTPAVPADPVTTRREGSWPPPTILPPLRGGFPIPPRTCPERHSTARVAVPASPAPSPRSRRSRHCWQQLLT